MPRPAPLRAPRSLASLIVATAVGLSFGAQALWVTEASAAKRPVTLVTTKANAAMGAYLVNAKGFTLYTFALDTSGKSACTGQCAAEWPPVLVPKGAKLSTLVHGLKASRLGKIRRANGAFQLTYLGKPLYRFVGDKRAGQTGGQGLEHAWSVATLTDGSATTTTSAPVAPPTTQAPSSSGSHSSSGGSGSTAPPDNPPATPAPTQPTQPTPTPTQPTQPTPAPVQPTPNPPTGGYGY